MGCLDRPCEISTHTDAPGMTITERPDLTVGGETSLNKHQRWLAFGGALQSGIDRAFRCPSGYQPAV